MGVPGPKATGLGSSIGYLTKVDVLDLRDFETKL
jgi:hypothetical protein